MSSPAPELLPEGGFTRIRCEISYDGSYFSGWNLQPDRRTVQSVVEDLLSRLMAIPVNTMVAGRSAHRDGTRCARNNALPIGRGGNRVRLIVGSQVW